MATAKSSSGTRKSSTPSSRTASGATAKKSASKSSPKSSQGSSKSATAKTGGSNKSAASKGSSSSKTGASKTAGTAKKAASKKSTTKSATSSAAGGSKTSTANKSGAAGKRTASGGAKKATASKSTAAKKSAANGKSKAAGNGSASKSKKGGSGILETVKNAVTGLFAAGTPNAIDLLTVDHRVVDSYFQKVKAKEDANHRETYKKIQFELDAHAHIEEAIFYPYLLEHGDKELKKIVREGIEEHRQVKLFLAELDELSGDNERFKAKLKVLMEDVDHHVQEEEDEMFAMVEDQIPREVLEKLGTQMEKEKARFQKRISPAKAKRARAAR